MRTTAIVTDSTQTVEKALRVVELDAVHYGLKLNRSKCAAILFDDPGSTIRFEDDTGVAQPDSAKHLGCYLYSMGDVGKELGRKLAEATRTWQKLGLFWKSAACSVKWQLMIYDAVIRAKLATMALTQH